MSFLGSIYGKIANVRNRFYDRGVFDSHYLGALVVSVGNITTGGTGKTPLVAYLARILAARGEKVCILTRGYGRENPKKRVLVSDGKSVLADPANAGDEPFELAQKLLGKAIVIADADRVAAGEWAKRKFDVTVFVLDDGFQHRKVKRDVDIVSIDAMNPFGGGKMFPAGRLREPLHNLSRADIVVITRANLVTEKVISNLKSEISDLKADAAIFAANNKISRIVTLEEFQAIRAETSAKHDERNAFAFCGIGNADNFFEQLRQDALCLVGTKAFGDHHIYSQKEINTLQNEAYKSSASILLTTAKDAVKLSNLKFEIPCYVVEIEMELDSAAAFAAMI